MLRAEINLMLMIDQGPDDSSPAGEAVAKDRFGKFFLAILEITMNRSEECHKTFSINRIIGLIEQSISRIIQDEVSIGHISR